MTDLSTFGIAKGKGNDHEKMIYSLALIYSMLSDRIENFLKQYDLSMGKLNVLIAIKHHGGKDGVPQVEISKHLIVTPSNMTKMIDKLEQEGLVKRFALEGDRRVNIVKITPKGSDLLESIWEQYNNQLKKEADVLTKDKQKKLAGLLMEWFERMQ